MTRFVGRLWLAWLAARAVWRAGWHTAAVGSQIEVRLRAPTDPRDAEIERLRAEVLRLRRAQQAPAPLPLAPLPRSAPALAPPPDASPRRGETGMRTPMRAALDYATQPRVNLEAIVGGLRKLGYGPKTAQSAAARAMQAGGEPGDIMRRALNCAQEG